MSCCRYLEATHNFFKRFAFVIFNEVVVRHNSRIRRWKFVAVDLMLQRLIEKLSRDIVLNFAFKLVLRLSPAPSHVKRDFEIRLIRRRGYSLLGKAERR